MTDAALIAANTNGGHPASARPHDYRCINCGRLQFRARLMPGSMVSIRCPKCGRMLVISPVSVTIDEIMITEA